MLRATIVDSKGTLVPSTANVTFTVTAGPGRAVHACSALWILLLCMHSYPDVTFTVTAGPGRTVHACSALWMLLMCMHSYPNAMTPHNFGCSRNFRCWLHESASHMLPLPLTRIATLTLQASLQRTTATTSATSQTTHTGTLHSLV
jgi:hypothetical protein